MIPVDFIYLGYTSYARAYFIGYIQPLYYGAFHVRIALCHLKSSCFELQKKKIFVSLNIKN